MSRSAAKSTKAIVKKIILIMWRKIPLLLDIGIVEQ